METKYCKWQYNLEESIESIDGENIWETECNNSFIMNNKSSPKENKVKYCCYCGNFIEEQIT